jgi:hypothetical protein
VGGELLRRLSDDFVGDLTYPVLLSKKKQRAGGIAQAVEHLAS